MGRERDGGREREVGKERERKMRGWKRGVEREIKKELSKANIRQTAGICPL